MYLSIYPKNQERGGRPEEVVEEANRLYGGRSSISCRRYRYRYSWFHENGSFSVLFRGGYKPNPTGGANL